MVKQKPEPRTKRKYCETKTCVNPTNEGRTTASFIRLVAGNKMLCATANRNPNRHRFE